MALDQVVCRKQRVVQNFLLVWLNTDIDRSEEDDQDTLTQLRGIGSDVKIFTEPVESIDFLTEVQNERVFLIVTGTLGREIIPLINDIPQLDATYIFCKNKLEYEQCTKHSTKIRDMYTEITSLCEALQLAIKQCNRDLVTISFIQMSDGSSSEDRNQLEPTFMYTQIFNEILFKMKYDENAIQLLADYCRRFYRENIRELCIIDEFQRDYRSKSPIWWYTRECFMYQMLNRALRGLETNTLFVMGFFLCDLHDQIEQLHRQQIGDYHGQPFVVYRGQGLSTTDFEKLGKQEVDCYHSITFCLLARIKRFRFALLKGLRENLTQSVFSFKSILIRAYHRLHSRPFEKPVTTRTRTKSSSPCIQRFVSVKSVILTVIVHFIEFISI